MTTTINKTDARAGHALLALNMALEEALAALDAAKAPNSAMRRLMLAGLEISEAANCYIDNANARGIA